jgi:hypothetical protein
VPLRARHRAGSHRVQEQPPVRWLRSPPAPALRPASWHRLPWLRSARPRRASGSSFRQPPRRARRLPPARRRSRPEALLQLALLRAAAVAVVRTGVVVAAAVAWTVGAEEVGDPVPTCSKTMPAGEAEHRGPAPQGAAEAASCRSAADWPRVEAGPPGAAARRASASGARAGCVSAPGAALQERTCSVRAGALAGSRPTRRGAAPPASGACVVAVHRPGQQLRRPAAIRPSPPSTPAHPARARRSGGGPEAPCRRPS